MITESTPLTEIAAFLDPESASRVFDEETDVQVTILSGLRYLLMSVEKQGEVYDPITLSQATSSYVSTFLTVFHKAVPNE